MYDTYIIIADGEKEMNEKNTKELTEVLGKTHLSEFDKFCKENKDNMNPGENAFSEYIKTQIKKKDLTQQVVFLRSDIPERY